jgi:hypothetical protein
MTMPIDKTAEIRALCQKAIDEEPVPDPGDDAALFEPPDYGGNQDDAFEAGKNEGNTQGRADLARAVMALLAPAEAPSPQGGETIERMAPSYPVEVVVAILDYSPCDKCGGPHVVRLDVSPTGFGCGSGYSHTPDCPELFCEHGTLWEGDCPGCEAEAVARRNAEEDEEEGDEEDWEDKQQPQAAPDDPEHARWKRKRELAEGMWHLVLLQPLTRAELREAVRVKWPDRTDADFDEAFPDADLEEVESDEGGPLRFTQGLPF